MKLEMFKMFEKEKPIDNVMDDKKGLKRSNFAENLASNIENYFKYNNESLTIGLMGEWGCGKTSLVNLTQKYLKDSEIKIMYFNPWIYNSYDHLIDEFFNELILKFTSKFFFFKVQMNKLYYLKQKIVEEVKFALLLRGNTIKIDVKE